MEDSLRYMMYVVLGLAVAGLLLGYFNGGISLITNLFLGENIEKIISDCELACLSGESYEFCTHSRTIISEKGSRESGTCKDFSFSYPDFFDKCLEIKCLEEGEISSFQGATSRDYNQILKAIQYAKNNVLSTSTLGSKEGKNCKCGNSCEIYAKAIDKYVSELNTNIISSGSSKPVLDPLLVVAMMMLESHCDSNAGSGVGCLGLLQVCPTTWCSASLLNGVISSSNCNRDLLNPEKNIQASILILNSYYRDSLSFECNGRKVIYHGWAAALRKYVGTGCTSDEQQFYVENVQALYNQLKAHTS